VRRTSIPKARIQEAFFCALLDPRLQKTTYLVLIALIELILDLKNRKKFEPTSIALPAASASSIAIALVIPLLPSGAGQSL
jgi:hypothetical protein